MEGGAERVGFRGGEGGVELVVGNQETRVPGAERGEEIGGLSAERGRQQHREEDEDRKKETAHGDAG